MDTKCVYCANNSQEHRFRMKYRSRKGKFLDYWSYCKVNLCDDCIKYINYDMYFIGSDLYDAIDQIVNIIDSEKNQNKLKNSIMCLICNTIDKYYQHDDIRRYIQTDKDTNINLDICWDCYDKFYEKVEKTDKITISEENVIETIKNIISK